MKPKVSEPHPTISGWCCACDVDQMTYRGMLKKALDQQKAEIVEMVRGMRCGGYYGCPRCGNQGICGSVVNETLDDIIKRLEGE